MSKLELFIKRCRRIWEEMSVEPAMMDKIIDTFMRPDIDLDKVTNEEITKDEDIKLSTQSFINNIIYSKKEDGEETNEE